jgi:hypothetical protein
MTLRLIALLLLLLTALPALAQNDKDDDKPDDPLAMPLPGGIMSAVRFTIGADITSADEQTVLLSNPVFTQVSADKSLYRFDFIVRDVPSASGKPSIGQFRIVFLFSDMASFSKWYARSETKAIISQLKALGARNLGMKFENIRTPSAALVAE